MFIEERLLDCVAFGTAGGPTWVTRKVALRSGKTRRNPLRSRPTYRFVVLFKNVDPGAHVEIINAFNACMGGVYGFRVKDWSDFEATDQILPSLGTGAPQTVQLQKVYTFGTSSVARLIRKPVVGTVQLTADNVPIASSVDYTTGEVTYTAPVGDVVRWSGEFDVPVTFSDDELPFSIEDRGASGFFLTADVTLEEDPSA